MWLGFTHRVPYGAVLTRGITVFVPGLSELYMYGEISEPGMRTYPPRMRRDRGVFPRGNSCRARLSQSLAKGGRGGALCQWDWGSENPGTKLICLLYYQREIRALRAPYFFLLVCVRRRSYMLIHIVQLLHD